LIHFYKRNFKVKMVNNFKDIVAGGCGGASGIFAGYPFDTVKVLMQTQEGGDKRKYFSTFQTIKRVIVEDGALRLYRGLSTPMATVAFTNALTFGVYGAMGRKFGDKSLTNVAANGGTAGSVRAFVLSPIEVLKIQQQVGKGKRLWEAGKSVVNMGGWRGFSRGLPATLTREPVAFTVYFTTFELLTRGRKDNTPLVFLSGGIAGVMSWVFTCPQDVIKSRVQGDDWGAKAKYSSTADCFKKSVSEEGWSVLYRGFGSVTYRAFIVNAVVLGVYNLVVTKLT